MCWVICLFKYLLSQRSNWTVTCFCKKTFIKTKPHSFIYMLPITAFVVTTETTWPTKFQLLLSSSLYRKFTNSCLYIILFYPVTCWIIQVFCCENFSVSWILLTSFLWYHFSMSLHLLMFSVIFRSKGLSWFKVSDVARIRLGLPWWLRG